MASSKRKSQPKRAAKHAVRSQPFKAATSAAHTATKTTAQDWTKQAQDWTQQSAKLYQLPFDASQVNEATKQAAAAAQSATENMMKGAADFWQNMWKNPQQSMQMPQMPQWNQLFSQTPSIPGFDGKAFKNFGLDSAGKFQKGAAHATNALNEAAALGRENAETCVACSNVAVNVSKDLGAELVSFANRSFAQNAELSKQLLGCRTLNDLFDLSGRLVKTNLDNFFSESVKVSELLFAAATEVSEPLNERLSDTTQRLTKAFAA